MKGVIDKILNFLIVIAGIAIIVVLILLFRVSDDNEKVVIDSYEELAETADFFKDYYVENGLDYDYYKQYYDYANDTLLGYWKTTIKGKPEYKDSDNIADIEFREDGTIKMEFGISEVYGVWSVGYYSKDPTNLIMKLDCPIIGTIEGTLNLSSELKISDDSGKEIKSFWRKYE